MLHLEFKLRFSLTVLFVLALLLLTPSPFCAQSAERPIPDSDFIQSLFQRKLPPFLEYYLFFSYKGDCSLFLENNDGTVELASELDLRAQAEADKMFGYNEDHGSILYNESVLSKINDLLVR